MQIKGNQLSEVMKSASSEAIDLISVSSFILYLMVYIQTLLYLIILFYFPHLAVTMLMGSLQETKGHRSSPAHLLSGNIILPPSLLKRCCSCLPSVIITFLLANFFRVVLTFHLLSGQKYSLKHLHVVS